MTKHIIVTKLREARKLIADHFTQETPARDIYGTPVHPIDPRAVCWCSAGAVMKVVDGNEENFYLVYRRLTVAVKQLHPGYFVTIINDGKGQAAMLKVFDRAIKNG